MTVIGNTVRTVDAKERVEALAPARPARSLFAPARISSAICAVILYFVIAAGGGQFCCNVGAFTAASLPPATDVLMAGSSVIALPLMAYEFPNSDIYQMLDGIGVIEAPKTERLISTFGTAKLSVYNSSNIGQSIEETAQIVQQLIAQRKDLRLLVLWVAPISVIADPVPPKTAQSAITVLKVTIKKPIEEFLRNCGEIHSFTQMRLSHLVSSWYGTLHLGGNSSGFYWNKVQKHYQDVYSRRILSSEKLKVFADILSLCQSHSIKTIVVSTPLSASNRALMLPGFYDRYRRTMREVVQQNSGDRSLAQVDSFIDLGQSPDFAESSDFQDSAHCNAVGAAKMLRIISPRMVQLLTGTESGGTAK
jgi:hypothetical protein